MATMFCFAILTASQTLVSNTISDLKKIHQDGNEVIVLVLVDMLMFNFTN
jgi:hypothetical protein